MSTKFRVESGIQLLTRLSKKPNLEKFHSKIFENGLRFGDFIELYSECSTACLLIDLISELLIPSELNGAEANLLYFNTDGNLNLGDLSQILRQKLSNRLQSITGTCSKYNLNNLDTLLDSALKNIYILNIYEPTQFYTSIQNMENILMKNANISLLVFDTITAFYWSEQNFKVTKMDTYLKNILYLIKKTVKDYKVIVLYTRPKYFSSSKESIENLDPCSKDSSEEQINYRIQIVYTDSGYNYITVRTYNKQFQLKFDLTNDGIVWL